MIILLILLGFLFVVLGAINPTWLLESRRAQLFVKLFGKGGARVCYIILGVILILSAIFWF